MSYFEKALLAATIIGATCGLLGVMVVLRRRVFFAQALTHGTFPGAVIAAALGVSVPLGAALAASLLLVIMFGITRVKGQSSAAAAGIILTGGFSLGLILQAMIPGIPVRPESFLIGSILTVTPADLWFAGTVALATLAALLLGGRRFLFSTVDPRGYRAAGFREWLVELICLVLIATVVVAALPAVGAILTIALIAAPATAARALNSRLLAMWILAPVIGAATSILGVLTSRGLGLPAGPAITLIASAVVVLSLLIQQVVTRFGRIR